MAKIGKIDRKVGSQPPNQAVVGQRKVSPRWAHLWPRLEKVTARWAHSHPITQVFGTCGAASFLDFSSCSCNLFQCLSSCCKHGTNMLQVFWTCGATSFLTATSFWTFQIEAATSLWPNDCSFSCGACLSKIEHWCQRSSDG